MNKNFFLLNFFLFACLANYAQTGTMSISPLPIDSSQQNIKQEIYRGSNERSNDLLHTKLDVSFNWKLCRLNGKATLELKPYFYPTDKLFLNARGMDIISLEVFDGINSNSKFSIGAKINNANYKYENDSLKIFLGKTFQNSSHYFVSITYVSKPNELKAIGGSQAITEDKGLYFINANNENPNKMPQIWTQGETQSNSVWFPTIDSPNEKMTQEIYINVEDKYTTLSNGILVSSTKHTGGTRTDYWKLDQAHAPYLAMMAVGEYKKVIDAPWKGKEISYYVEKEYEPHAKSIFGNTKEMIECFSNRLGVPYAWPKYAQVVARDYVSGAMENTSATLHGDFMVYQTTRETIDNNKANGVIAHELFHQWFGDLVTCESWSNLSLNESFATYGEYLWNEYKFGREDADYHFFQGRQGYLNSKKVANLIRFHYEDKEDMFDAISYNKGGQILHMLRKAVGDDAFFASLKNYLETNKFQSAEVHDLRLAFERTTGKDLNWFFNQWYLNKSHPVLKVSYRFNNSNGTVILNVEQKQDLSIAPLFVLPLEVDIYVNEKVERKNIVVQDQKNEFVFKTDAPPKLVNFDAERQLLCNLDYQKTTEEYLFQYYNAPLVIDRQEALMKLEGEINKNEKVFDLFKKAAQNDKYYELRIYAIKQLDNVWGSKMPDLKPLLLTIYRTDTKTLVRAEALSLLNSKFEKEPDLLDLNLGALNEQSYAICAKALEALSIKNQTLAAEKAKIFENENSSTIFFALAKLYSKTASDEQINYLHKTIFRLSGYSQMGFLSYYAKTVNTNAKSTTAIQLANDLELMARSASKNFKYMLKQTFKNLIDTWDKKILEAQAEPITKSTANTNEQINSMAQTKVELQKIFSNIK